MEAFSLLNYWKNNTSGLSLIPPSSDSSGEATTIVTTSVSVTETDTDEDEEDEGPFFDLKFAPPLEDTDSDSNDEVVVDPDLDDVYFTGKIVEEDEEEEEEEIEPPSSSSTEQSCSVKAPAAQLSASILKSASKLGVFMLKMKKQKKSEAIPPSPESQQKSTVTVNLLKVEEVPIVSLFGRDNSSRNTSSSSSSTSSSSTSSSSKKQNGNEPCVLEETRFVMMHKYLKKVKPLYVRVSRRYGEKLRYSGSEKKESPATKTKMVKSLKPGNMSISIPAGLKVVRKHLGKSRSSSSTTTATTTAVKESTTAASVATVTESRRRDDSLLQQQDSIQSAILHCKRSFNSSRDKDPSVLPRSVSDPSSYDN